MNTDHALRLEAGVTRQVAFRLITRGCGNSASYDKWGFRTQVIEAKHETCEASAVSGAEIVVLLSEAVTPSKP